MFTVVTSYSSKGWEQYGKTFVETFKEFWPASVRLLCAWEGPGDGKLDGFDLLETEPCASFLARHKDNLIVSGLREDKRSPWSSKERQRDYSFRHDAYKFAHKVFAVAAAARYVENGKLFWIDADTITKASVPEGLLHDLLPDKVSLCYLARPGYHSELGFVGYNLDRQEMRDFIARYERRYAEDEFLDDPAWDDCWQFDRLVKLHVPHCKWITHTNRGQPFDNSILGHYMTHLKGRKKAA